MRLRLLPVLANLYLLAGLAFLVGAGLRLRGGAEVGSTLDALPWWVFLVAAALDFVLGAAILRRVKGALWALRVLHALLAVAGALALGVAWNRAGSVASSSELGLDLAKVLVHALMAVFWWRSRAAVQWFAATSREIVA